MPSDITLEDFQCIGRRIFKASLKRCSEIQSPSTSHKVSGGHILIFNPGGPDPEYYKPEDQEPKDGGTTYTW